MPTCPYCGQPAIPVTGKYLHPWQPRLHHKRFWICEPCDASVGCHPTARYGARHEKDGWRPLGTLANKRLRAWRAHFHGEFDVLWRGQGLYKVFSRGQAYSWLAKETKLPKAECHIGLFNEAQCIVGINIVQKYKEELAKASTRKG